MPRWLLPVLAVVGVVLFALPQGAQAEEARVEITHVDTSAYPLVRLTAPVLDASGAAIDGLTAPNFAITQNDLPVEITSVKTAVDSDVGAGVVLVIDVSGSMRGTPLSAAKKAARDFVDGLAPSDLVAIVTFADSVQLVQPFTADRAAAKAVIEGLIASGDTALYDAASQGLDFATQSGLQRQAVVLLSDGANDPPERPPLPQEVYAKAAANAIPVFSVTLGEGADAAFSEELARTSGGAAYIASSPSELPGLYSEVASRLNNEYIIEYQAPADIGFQEVSLRVSTAVGDVGAATEFDILSLASGVGPKPGLPGVEPGAEIGGQRTLSPNVEGEFTSLTASLDGEVQELRGEGLDELPFQPAALTPGRHELSFEATAADGTTGRYDLIIEVPEVDPVILIDGADGATLRAGDRLSFEVLAQGRAVEPLAVSVGEVEFSLDAAPFVLILPASIAEGSNAVEVTATVEGDEVSAKSSVEFIPPAQPASIVPFVLAAAAVFVLLGFAYLVYRRRRKHARSRPEEYVPGARNSYEPVAAANAPAMVAETAVDNGRGPRARLRAIAGPDKGKTYFLGHGSAVIGTAPECTVQVTLPGWETAPELIRIWARDDKYMFHQVAPGPVSIAGREVQWAILESGDEIRVHEHVFLFEVPEVARANHGADQGVAAA